MSLDKKTNNINVFNNTQNFISGNSTLEKAIINTSKNKKFYLSDYEPTAAMHLYTDKANITVTMNTTFDAARAYKDGKTAVLNFASATNPGGGVVNGANAQEECLCRASTLYYNLVESECMQKFYGPHRVGLPAYHNDDIIYLPDVCVFKADTDYRILPESDWKYVDVITCAAPNLRTAEEQNLSANYGEGVSIGRIDNESLYDLMFKRISKIISVAAENGVDNLILGAFGCGAFKCDPYTVAIAFKDALDNCRNNFKNIEFAVYCNPSNQTNYNTFKKVLIN